MAGKSQGELPEQTTLGFLLLLAMVTPHTEASCTSLWHTSLLMQRDAHGDLAPMQVVLEPWQEKETGSKVLSRGRGI